MTDPAMPVADEALVERIAWAILQALHANVSEDERPQSWSDLKDEQEKRIFAAAHATMIAIAESDFLEAIEALGRARGLEEAAKVADEEYRLQISLTEPTAAFTAEAIAAAIRALKPASPSPSSASA
jgi:hypothetical protein